MSFTNVHGASWCSPTSPQVSFSPRTFSTAWLRLARCTNCKTVLIFFWFLATGTRWHNFMSLGAILSPMFFGRFSEGAPVYSYLARWEKSFFFSMWQFREYCSQYSTRDSLPSAWLAKESHLSSCVKLSCVRTTFSACMVFSWPFIPPHMLLMKLRICLISLIFLRKIPRNSFHKLLKLHCDF